MSLGRIVDRLLGAVTWAKVTASKAEAGKIGKVWVQGLVGNFLQHHQPYGFQSRPKPGADAVVLSMGSSASDRIATQIGDRRYTLALTAAGDVAVYNDLGYCAVFGRDGVVVGAPSIKLGANAALGVARATDPIALDADVLTWLNQVYAAAISDPPAGGPAEPLGAATGTITSGSTVVRSE